MEKNIANPWIKLYEIFRRDKNMNDSIIELVNRVQEDQLPKCKEPLIGVDENEVTHVIRDNYKATVLAYNPALGFYKAEYSQGKWSEISSNSINGTDRAIPTHWKYIDEPEN